MTDFRGELLNAVRMRADVDGEYTRTAFVQEVSERLSEAEQVDNLVSVHFDGVGGNRKRLRVDGYDLGDADDSVVLAVAIFNDEDQVTNVTATEVAKALGALEGYLHDAVNGTFEVDREPSDPAVQLAVDLRHRGASVTRYRLYLLCDAPLSSSVKHLPSSELNGVPIDFHVWDINRFEQLQTSSQGREELQISLLEWLPEGMQALRIEGDSGFETYLAAVPGSVLADLYGRHGSRLLESNVRAFLQGRGKVNKGIKTTILSEPDMFLAYNNGVTATATGVELDSFGRITGITDLQIVNGGQTTASLFYVRRDSSPKPDISRVHVQMKLVVVDEERAKELVPSISRYANSQNKVSEADFFSNSPFHVRLENLSRRLLAPARPGIHFQTRWFYERTRGQYQNEKAKLTPAEQKKFDASNPRSQVITKTDAAKYEVSWGQQPHMVSAGAQKNFVAFAESVAKKWETSDAEFNEAYFKGLVAKAILFHAIRTRVAKSEWYQSGYLANIVTYAMAKVAHEVQRQKPSQRMNFDIIWRQQSVPEVVLSTFVDAAYLAFEALTAERRPVQNVTEWAKRSQCWDVVKAMPMRLEDDFVDTLVSASAVREDAVAARKTQKIDNSIQVQAAVFEIPTATWQSVREFSIAHKLVSPTDASILDLVTGRKSGFPSERQSARLLAILQKAKDHGFVGAD
ncbi:AIPR family protein [Janibacter hoylei]